MVSQVKTLLLLFILVSCQTFYNVRASYLESKSCFQNLFPSFTEQPFRFTFYLDFPQNISPLLKSLMNSLAESCKSPMVVLSGSSIKRSPGVGKFQQSIFLVFGDFPPMLTDLFIATTEQIYLHYLPAFHTIFVLIHFRLFSFIFPVTVNPTICYPSLTLVITFTQQKYISTHIIADGTEMPVLINTEHLIFVNPSQFQRRMLWNANGMQYPVLVFLGPSYWYSWLSPKTREGMLRRTCLPENAKSKDCSSDTMMSLILPIVHNFTTEFHNAADLNDIMRYQVNSGHGTTKHIILRISMENYSVFPPYAQSQYKFRQTDFYSLSYCERLGTAKTLLQHLYSWLKPMDKYVWVLVMLLGSSHVIFLFICSNLKETSEKIEILKKLMHCTMVMAGMFICWFYQNDLLSMVAVVEIPKTFKTVEELLNAKYKIYAQESYGQKPEQWLKFDFDLLGLGNRLNSSLYKPPSGIDLTVSLEKAKGNKIATFYESDMWVTTRLEKVAVTKLTGKNDWNCRSVQQKVLPRYRHWKINTSNRRWLMVTIQRFAESGLSFQWDQWSLWKLAMDHGVLQEKSSTFINPEYIKWNQVKMLLMGVAVCMFIAVAAWLIELYKSPLTPTNKFQDNGNNFLRHNLKPQYLLNSFMKMFKKLYICMARKF